MNPVEHTLLEQLRYSEAEIRQRKELLQFGTDDVAALTRCRGSIATAVDDIVTSFYAEQTRVPEIAVIIGDADTLKRLKAAQRQYILDLFEGFYDLTYVNNRLRIGLVHKRIGVEPKLYLSALQRLRELLQAHILNQCESEEQSRPIISALDKLLNFDVQLVVDTYIRSLMAEVETSKTKALTYAHELEDIVAQRTRELEHLSRTDGLTSLCNRRAFTEQLRRDTTLAARQGNHLGMLYIDVDDFKQINDQHGHLRGDEVLIALAGAINDTARASDVGCRYGGDEFCVLLPDCDEAAAMHFAQRLLNRFKELQLADISIGVAGVAPTDDTNPQELVNLADHAMYRAKSRQGSNIVPASNLTTGNPP